MIAFPLSVPAFRICPRSLAAALFLVMGLGGAARAVPLRFLPLGEEVAGRKIGIRDSKGITGLKDLNAKKRSKAYQCNPGDAPLALVALDRERPDDKPASVPLTVAPEMKSPLVLILPSADDPSGMRAIVVDDSNAGFPWGALLFVNTTDKPLTIRSGKETTAIAKSPAVADVIIDGAARNLGIQIYPEFEPDHVLYSAVWEHDPNLRKLIFIVAAADPSAEELTLGIVPQDKRAKE